MPYADTPYADVDTFLERLNLDDAEPPPTGMAQGLLNAAARVVDAISRHPPDGWTAPAFGQSDTRTRRYPDAYTPGEPVPIDDLLTGDAYPVTVQRGGVTLTEDEYLLWPLDDLPKTRIYLAPGAGSAGSGALAARVNVKVIGTWGYCDQVDRPPEIAEATLLQAVIFYQRYGLDVEALANAVGDPLAAADKTVARMLRGVTKS